MQCPSCGFVNRPDDRFCAKCGTRLVGSERSCPSCLRQVPVDAEFCPNCGIELPGHARAQAEGSQAPLGPSERKPVTILFADIVGSTEKAEALDPEEWREVVAGAHERVGEAVGRYEGTVAQLLGDGVLAYFGAPVTHEDDPERAVRAALDLQQLIREYSEELAGYVDGFAMRVGIHTGTVVVGEVGSNQKSEYLAVGDAVNVAARLEGAARPGHILVSEQVGRRVEASFALEGLGSLELKGVSAPVRAFEVRGRKAEPDRARGLGPTERVFVGRQRELEELQQSILRLCQGHGQICFILGEAGIGKTRLVEELRARLPALQFQTKSRITSPDQVRWVEGRAVSYGTGLSFWLITQLLLSDLDMSEGAPMPMIRAALRMRLKELFSQRSDEHEPFLSRLLGLKLKPGQDQRLAGYDSETLRHETLRSVNDYFEAAASRTPLVLVLEDLHWADASSLEALEQLLEVTDRAPLMILGLMRLERDHGSWDLRVKAETDFGHRYQEFKLGPLDAVDAEHLLIHVLGTDSQDSEIGQLVLGKAEGNPFYLEELLRHLMELQLIVREDGEWKGTAELKAVGVPDTLQGVVLARIDRLQEDVQHTLQLASVIGRSFLYRLLEVISGEHERLHAHLSQLQRADLIREKKRLPELEYIFKHAVTQEAAYSSLLVEERRRFHKRVAQAVEAQFLDRLDEFAGLLAYHYESAGESDQAIKYLSVAADQARLQDSLEEAKGLLQRLISLLEQDSRTDALARAWMKLGLVHQTNFEFPDAHQAYERAFELEDLSSTVPKDPFSEDDRGPDGRAELRIPIIQDFGSSVDLNEISSVVESRLRRNLQAGLAMLDRELNVVPHAARSWEVRDGGLTYVFHLREDLRWSDGSQVTASDYVDYWRWEIKNASASASSWLTIVRGAERYRDSENASPDVLAVHKLTPSSFEVRLKEPAAHFLYLIVLHGYPAPMALIEEHGQDWWLPPHGLYSGPFFIERWGNEETVLRRNPEYFGRSGTNLETVRFSQYESMKQIAQAYEADQADICWSYGITHLDHRTPGDQLVSTPGILSTHFVMFNPGRPPTSDRRFRAAISLTLDRSRFPAGSEDRLSPATGGLVPPGIPGHSPDLSIRPDRKRGRQLADETKESGSELSEPLLVGQPSSGAHAPLEACAESLGIEFAYRLYQLAQLVRQPGEMAPLIFVGGWIADYPDPYNFLVTMVQNHLRWMGWSDPGFDALVSEVAKVRSRKGRMDLFRRIDRYLVQDQVLVVPVYYGKGESFLVKPWVKGYQQDVLSMVNLKDVTVVDHERG